MINDWTRIHALEFESTFAKVWRDQNSDWLVKFNDWDSELDLKVDSLKSAIEKAENLFLEQKYNKPKAKKIVKPAKERAARKKKTEVAEPKKKKFPRKTTKKKRKNVNSTKKGK